MANMLRRVAVLGGTRIPFARANGAYNEISNQQMLTAVMSALVEKYDLKNQKLGEVAAGAVAAGNHFEPGQKSRGALADKSHGVVQRDSFLVAGRRPFVRGEGFLGAAPGPALLDQLFQSFLGFLAQGDELDRHADVGLDAAHRQQSRITTFCLEAHVTYHREVRAGDPLRFTTRLLVSTASFGARNS